MATFPYSVRHRANQELRGIPSMEHEAPQVDSNTVLNKPPSGPTVPTPSLVQQLLGLPTWFKTTVALLMFTVATAMMRVVRGPKLQKPEDSMATAAVVAKRMDEMTMAIPDARAQPQLKKPNKPKRAQKQLALRIDGTCCTPHFDRIPPSVTSGKYTPI